MAPGVTKPHRWCLALCVIACLVLAVTAAESVDVELQFLDTNEEVTVDVATRSQGALQGAVFTLSSQAK